MIKGKYDPVTNLVSRLYSFNDFWEAWPKGMRKVSKQLCERKWKNMHLDDEAETIVAHVNYLKTTEQWKKSDGAFIPMPLTYLNQQRWDGAEIPTTTFIDRDAIYKQQLEASIRAYENASTKDRATA